MTRLLVHPMPLLNPNAPGAGMNLPLSATINLNRPVRDVQGCTFITPTQLLCSSDDPAGELFGMTKPLLRVDLAAPLAGIDVTGYVTALGKLREVSWCSGTFEVEGIDYDDATGDLRAEVIQPGFCAFSTTVWRMRYQSKIGSITSALAPTKCVDVNANSGADGARVQIWDCNGTTAQRTVTAAPTSGGVCPCSAFGA